MNEAIAPTRLCNNSQACRWTFLIPRFQTLRDQKGAPSTYEIRESSSAHVLLVTSESVHHIMTLLVVRLIRYEDQVKEIHDLLMEIPLERIETLEQKVETIRDKTEAAEQRIKILQESLGIARDIIPESQIPIMHATRQGINSVDIEQLIAQHVANAMTTYEANRASKNKAHNETSRSAGGVEHAVRNCSYKEFLSCKPHNFKGTEGAVGLRKWSQCSISAILLRTAKYIWGLTNDIQGNVTSSKPQRIGEAIHMTHDLIDQRVREKAVNNGEYKRKWEGSHQNNFRQQNKRQEVVRAYTTRPDNKNEYAGKLPLCYR
ncbi:hypothetical protein Tco_0836423 [Tanacetum coccineum]